MNRIASTLVVGCIMILAAGVLHAQHESASIEGIYMQSGTPAGLSVTKLQDGNYLFQKVLIKENGEVVPHEWQSAYVISSPKMSYLFYWHTGRYEDIPGTNALIVYELTAVDGRLTGIYFFPEEPRTPPAVVDFIKR